VYPPQRRLLPPPSRRRAVHGLGGAAAVTGPRWARPHRHCAGVHPGGCDNADGAA